MSKKYLLGMDNGGTTVKAGLYDTDGNEIATARTNVAQICPHDGWLERNVPEVIEANCAAIRGVLEKSGIDPADVLGLSMTGYANGAFFVDEKGAPTYPNCIVSGDMRGKDIIKRFISDGTQDKILPYTCQTVWAGQTVPLIVWMKENHPEILDKTRYVMSCTDFLRLVLTGEAASEVSNASTISSMDLNTKKFSQEVFDAMGIGAYIDRMPERIVGSAEIAGRITEEMAKRTGLKAGTPVMGGLADITACSIATGVTDDTKLCVVFGTWSINEYISKKPISDPNLFMTSLYCMDKYYLITEGSTTSASNLQWFVDQFMGEEATAMKAEGKNVYDACEAMISSIPYDDSSIVFLPFLFGSNVSLDAKSAFIGINGRHSKAHMLRAVYEGIVFSHMYHIEKLMKFRDKAPEAVRISGGGASSNEWCQMFSDVLQLPVEVPAAKELGSMGVAICIAIGAGLFSSFEDAAKAFAKVKKVYKPNPERAEYYRNKYAIYKKLIEALDPVWGEYASVEK